MKSKTKDKKKSDMLSWEDIRRKDIAKELLCVAAIVFTFAVGALCEFFAERGTVIWTVVNYGDVSLAAVQIQATVMSLTVAIIALISGQMDKSFRGVPYNKFCMHIKPVIFTQMRLIIISMALIPVNIGIHILELYNLALAVMIVSIILILISIRQIYTVFLGTRETKHQIEMYLNYCFRVRDKYYNNDIALMVKLLDDYIEDWCESVGQESNSEFESNHEFFTMCGAGVLKSNSGLLMSCYNRSCSRIVATCSKDERYAYRGLIILQNTYSTMWQHVINNQETVQNSPVSFDSIDDAVYDLWYAIKDATIETFEKHQEIVELGEYALRVKAWIHPSKESIKTTGEAMNAFIRLAVINAAKKAPHNIRTEKWLKPLKSPFVSTYNIPPEFNAVFAECKAELYFHYALGLILGGRMDVLKESLYLTAYNRSYELDKELLEIAVALQCYIYYLAAWETEACASKDLIDECRCFLEDNRVKFTYGCVMERLVSNDLLKVSLYQRVFNLLRPLELFPKNDNAKTLVMEDAVHMFIYYSMLYYGNKYCLRDINDEIVDISSLDYAALVVQDERRHENRLAKQFVSYHVFMPKDKSAEKAIERNADMLVNQFEKIVVSALKKQIDKNADEVQDEFDEVGKSAYERDFVASAKNLLRTSYSSLFKAPTKNTRRFNCKLFSLTLPTKDLKEERIDEFSGYIQANFMDWLGGLLLENRMLTVEHKGEDQEFLDMLAKQNITHIAGNRLLFSPRKYSAFIGAYRQFENKTNSDYLEYGSCLFAFNAEALHLDLKGVRVKIRDMTLEESDAERISDDNYKYQVSGMDMNFKETELRSYIAKQYKVIEIFVSVALDITDENIGVFIKRDV